MASKEKSKSSIPLLPPINTVIKETTENKISLEKELIRKLESETNRINNEILVQMGNAVKQGFNQCSQYIADRSVAKILVARYIEESYDATYSSSDYILRLSWIK